MADESPAPQRSAPVFGPWLGGDGKGRQKAPEESEGAEERTATGEQSSGSAGPSLDPVPYLSLDSALAEAEDDRKTSGPAEGAAAGSEDVFEAVASPSTGRFESPHLGPLLAPAPRPGTPSAPAEAGTLSPRRRRRPVPVRRRSAGSNASGEGRSRAGSVSGHSYISRPESPFSTEDMYLGNMAFPTWDETEDGVEYKPWPPETDARLAELLREVTNPPRDGMFARVDSRKTLQEFMAKSDPEIQPSWESMLRAYDFAMNGKRSALLALGAAHKRILDLHQRNIKLDENSERLYHANAELNRAVDRLEKEAMKQQKYIANLEETKRTLTRDSSILKTKHDRAVAAQDKQLETLETIAGGWQTLSSTTAPRGPTGSIRGESGASLEERFESVREVLEDARVDAFKTRQRCERLEDKYDALRKMLEEKVQEEVNKRIKSQSAPEPQEEVNSELAAEAMRLAMELKALEKELEAEQTRAADKERKQAELITRLRSEGKATSEDQREEIDRLKRELALYKSKCGVLQQSIDELKKTLAGQAIKVSQEKKEYESEMQELDDQFKDTTDKISHVLGQLVGSAGTEAVSGDEEATRTKQAFQVLDKQASKDAVNEIKSLIKDVIERISADIKEEHTMQLEDKKKIIEEMRKLAVETDAMVKGHEVMVETQGHINNELTSLWEQIHGKQLVRQERARIKAAGDLPHPTDEYSERLSEEFEAIPLAASEHEINCLLGARYHIEQLKQNSAKVGMQEAARQCLKELGTLLQKLKSVDPDTPTEDVIRALMQFLEKSLEGGISKADAPRFYAALEEHDGRVKNLLEPRQPIVGQSDAEMHLLHNIREKLEAAEKLQNTQEQLMREYAEHVAKQPPGKLTAQQSAELLRLANAAVEASGSNWTWPTLTGRGAAGADRVVSQIQSLVADPYLCERRRRLEEGIKEQAIRLADLEAKIQQAIKLADDARSQLDAHARLQVRSQGSTTATEDETNQRFETDLKRRESRLRQEQHVNLAYLDRLQAGRMRAATFVEREVASDRHRAEALLTDTLLKLPARGPASHDGEALCFCTLLRFLAPDIYYSTVSGGCCAGGRMVSSSQGTQAGAACRGHHGHGILSSSGSIWPAVCRILTAFAWLVMLILIQPYNLYAAAAFLFSLLVGVPRYAYSLAENTYSWLHHRRTVGNGNANGDNNNDRETRDKNRTDAARQHQTRRIWYPVDFLLTAIVGLNILLLICPYKFYAAAAFLFALLVGVPRYVYRLAEHIWYAVHWLHAVITLLVVYLLLVNPYNLLAEATLLLKFLVGLPYRWAGHAYSRLRQRWAVGDDNANGTDNNDNRGARDKHRRDVAQRQQTVNILDAAARLSIVIFWLNIMLITYVNIYAAAANAIASELGVRFYAFLLLVSAYSALRLRWAMPNNNTNGDNNNDNRWPGDENRTDPAQRQQPQPQPQPAAAAAAPQAEAEPEPEPEPMPKRTLFQSLKSHLAFSLPSLRLSSHPLSSLPFSIPPPAVLVSAALSLALAYLFLSYLALLIERHMWVRGSNDWRFAYARELADPGVLPYDPYPGWAGPFRVDYRLVLDPVVGWVARGAHGVLYGGWWSHWGREGGVGVGGEGRGEGLWSGLGGWWPGFANVGSLGKGVGLSGWEGVRLVEGWVRGLLVGWVLGKGW